MAADAAGRPYPDGPPDLEVASAAAYDHVSAAYNAVENSLDPSAVGRLRVFVDALRRPVSPTVEEARAAFYVADLVQVDVPDDDPRVLAILAPSRFITNAAAYEILQGVPAPTVRRALQRLRDEGRISVERPGVWRVPSGGVESWPATDRAEGWVVVKSSGKLRAL